jgi:hypothetical protein
MGKSASVRGSKLRAVLPAPTAPRLREGGSVSVPFTDQQNDSNTQHHDPVAREIARQALAYEVDERDEITVLLAVVYPIASRDAGPSDPHDAAGQILTEPSTNENTNEMGSTPAIC